MWDKIWGFIKKEKNIFLYAIGLILVIVVGLPLFYQNAESFISVNLSTPSDSVKSPIGPIIPGISDSDPIDSYKPVKKDVYEIAPSYDVDSKKKYSVYFTTNKGVFSINLYPDLILAKENFLALVEDKFYDGLSIHYVEKDFLLQTGDGGVSRDGSAGYFIDDEISELNVPDTTVSKASFLRLAYEPLDDSTSYFSPTNLSKYSTSTLVDFYTDVLGYKYISTVETHKFDVYSVAYSNLGPDTNSSQFFIICGKADKSRLQALDGRYTVFGEVFTGKNVIDSICKSSVDEFGSPTKAIYIEKAVIK